MPFINIPVDQAKSRTIRYGTDLRYSVYVLSLMSGLMLISQVISSSTAAFDKQPPQDLNASGSSLYIYLNIGIIFPNFESKSQNYKLTGDNRILPVV